jgi:hypothetical protein
MGYLSDAGILMIRERVIFNFERLREKKRISYSDWCVRAGLSAGVITKFISRPNGSMGFDKIEALARAVGESVDSIIGPLEPVFSENLLLIKLDSGEAAHVFPAKEFTWSVLDGIEHAKLVCGVHGKRELFEYSRADNTHIMTTPSVKKQDRKMMIFQPSEKAWYKGYLLTGDDKQYCEILGLVIHMTLVDLETLGL